MSSILAAALAAAATLAAVPSPQSRRRLQGLAPPRNRAAPASSGGVVGDVRERAGPVRRWRPPPPALAHAGGGRDARRSQPVDGTGQGRRRPLRGSRGQGRRRGPGGKAGCRAEAPPLLLTPAARRVLGGMAGLGLWVSVGGVLGLVLALAAMAALPRLIARLPDPGTAARLRRIADDVPLTLDLITSCLRAGAPLSTAVRAVGGEVGGPLSAVLADVAGHLDLGAAPVVAWRRAGELPPLQPVVETVIRVGDSGAALAPAFAQLAAEERERARRAQEVAVRRIGVFVVIPLGLCFLPAFLLIGVVPIVAGLVSGLLI